MSEPKPNFYLGDKEINPELGYSFIWDVKTKRPDASDVSSELIIRKALVVEYNPIEDVEFMTRIDEFVSTGDLDVLINDEESLVISSFFEYFSDVFDAKGVPLLPASAYEEIYNRATFNTTPDNTLPGKVDRMEAIAKARAIASNELVTEIANEFADINNPKIEILRLLQNINQDASNWDLIDNLLKATIETHNVYDKTNLIGKLKKVVKGPNGQVIFEYPLNF